MTTIGFHASHEQFAPSRLLACVKRAQEAGFDAAMCSDHFHPWSARQAQSGFAWSWLGSALETTRLTFGTVCAPGQRYHPAIIAQAAATLAEMYPGRFWLALGSGEFLNEHITGQPWPSREDRDARLHECVDIIRTLWNGEAVTHLGHVHVNRAQLHTRPEKSPPIMGAALTPQAAEWMGAWADGLITVGGEVSAIRDVIAAFRRGGGEGKPVFIQIALCFGRTEEEAMQEAHDQWRHCVLEGKLFADLATPEEFDRACDGAGPDEVCARLHVSSSAQQHLDWLLGYLELPLTAIYLHHVGRGLERFIDVFGEHVLPFLREPTSKR
jgi:coenzyme F420-dependent glucose-6-phosphate dehydrogenase